MTGYSDAMVAEICWRLIPGTTVRRILVSGTVGIASAGIAGSIGPSLVASGVPGNITDTLNAGAGAALVTYIVLVMVVIIFGQRPAS
ncbi:MAG: hypothetical protein EBY11_14000 [Proteobacteria bacterium]|nr:hypothetical protein [Pseudomonadota bacterium]NBX47588.1 hypothetical protein [Chloroflexota bacterium]NDG99036.1 hypothetical protein [Pseudomonadota bacterium]